jgi:hypothetical protein
LLVPPRWRYHRQPPPLGRLTHLDDMLQDLRKRYYAESFQQ